MARTSVAAEVVRLHDFFDAWYAGADHLTIEQFSDAMDPLFVIVSPDGTVMARDRVVDAVNGAFGTGGVSITVENFHVVERNGYVLCRYDEVHRSPDGETRRISTAVMEPDPSTPGGYRWLTVHETWLPS